MKAAKSFEEILALRGRILLFTPTASIALPFEQAAIRRSAELVCTRGVVDATVPLSAWTRLQREQAFSVLSCDQVRYIHSVHIPATDIVWVGETGHPNHWPELWTRFCQAMSRANAFELAESQLVRQWICHQDAIFGR